MFNRSNALTYGGVISGSGSLTKIGGGGTLTLTGDSSYTGGTIISGGTLQLGNGGANGSIVGDVASHGVLAFDRSDSTVFGGLISGAGSVEQRGIGTTILTGANTYTRGTTISAGMLQIGNGGTAGSIVGNIVDNAALAFDRSDAVTFGGRISGAGSLNSSWDRNDNSHRRQYLPGRNHDHRRNAADWQRRDDGQHHRQHHRQCRAGVQRSNALTYAGMISGATFVNAGTLQIGNGGTAGSVTGNIVDNAALVFNRSNALTYGGVISGSGSLTKIGGRGTLTLTGDSSYTGGTIISGGTLQLGNGGASGSIIGDVASHGVLAFDRSDSTVFDGVISGAGSVEQRGSGTTILTGANTYTRGTTISAGTLQIGNGGTAGSIVGNIVDNAALAFDRSDAVTFGGRISGAGSLTQAGSGTTILTDANTYQGGTVISAGTLQIGDGGIRGSVTGNIVDNAVLMFNRSNALIYAGMISGAGSVIQAGTGTTILAGANTYTGATFVNAGMLQIGTGLAGSVTGNIVDNAALVFNRSNALTYGGVISGSGSFTKVGSGGTLTMTGDSSYTGGTIISGGTLQLGNGGASGSIIGDVASHGVLAFNRSDSTVFGGVISGAGSVEQRGIGTTILTGTNTYTRGTTISAGMLQIGNGGTAGSVAGNIVDNAALAFDRSDAVTFGGRISGAGSLIQAGIGTTILTGANTYTGGTTVDAGTLQMGARNAFSRNSAFAVASTGTLDFNSFNQTIGSLAGDGNVALGSAILTSGADNSSTTFSGVISGSGGLAKTAQARWL